MTHGSIHGPSDRIDHFITEKSESFRFTDAGICDHIIDSDHRAIYCKLRIMVKLKKKSSPRERLLHLNYTKLRDDTTRSTFCNSVAEKFAVMSQTQTTYSRLAAAVEESTKQILPKHPRAPPGWFSAAEDELAPLI